MSDGWRLRVDPLIWAPALPVGLVLALPASQPLFAALFPGLERPLYLGDPFWRLLLDHIGLVAASSAAATLIGVGLGVAVTRPAGVEFRRLAESMGALGQTFPPVAVLAIAVPILGFGTAPAILALALYGLLPVLQNTLTGLDRVPGSVRDAALGCGMTNWDLLWQIDLPLAAPVILAGVRTSVTINIGTAAIASTVGAKTLGLPIIIGLNAGNPAYVVQGALVVGALAVAAEFALARLARLVAPERRQ